MGHQRAFRRLSSVRSDAPRIARLLHPLRRSDLCRRPDPGRSATARRLAVDQLRYRGEVARCTDARRLSRRLCLQPARQEQARVFRRGAVPRAVGRPRGAQQLVPRPADRPGREALSGAQRIRAGRPRKAGDVRVQPVPFQPRRPRADLPRIPVRPAARRVHAGRAQLSRSQLAEPADHAGCGFRFPRPGADGVAEANAQAVKGHVEGDCQRHADLAGGA